MLEKLSEIKHDDHLCHGDFHVFNLIISDGRVMIIDWVDASAGNPEADAYRTYLLYTEHSNELADLYLRLYCEKSGASRDEILSWAPIIAGARLSENLPSEKMNFLVEMMNRHCP